MVVYRERRTRSIGKWLVAAVIFILAMTITFDDVEGAVRAVDLIQF